MAFILHRATLFLQEHGLYKSQFGGFDKIDNGVGKHCVSAMNENKLLRGRPNGGAVILWRKNINHKVVPVEYDSDRMCAVTVHVDEGILLLVCVYMPCDDRRPNDNLLEYIQVLNDIEVVCNIVDANFVCIGGGGSEH